MAKLKVQPERKRKYRDGITRRATPKQYQIKWTAELEMQAVYTVLEDRGWTKLIGMLPVKVPDKVAAIHAKVDKIIDHHRHEQPKFIAMVDRKGRHWFKSEDQKLVQALKSRWIYEKYDNPYEYISKVFGRPEDELRTRAEFLLDKKGLF